MTEVSSTRLYLGNLPRNATKADVEAHFNTHGTGEITEIKLMNGFGFIEYKDAMDARDVVPAFHGSDFMGERLTVQFARGTRNRDTFANPERTAPRPRRTPHRMQISGLPGETSWQDLKDFARQSSLDVVYSETGRDRDGKGSFVEFETAADLKTAVEKLDGREFKGARVTCTADTQPDIPRDSRARDLDPPFLEDDLTQLTIMIDVVHPVVTVHVVMPIVIAAHLAVAITMMTVVVMVAHHHLDPVVPSTITHHHVAVASMIPIVITHPEMPDMLMTDTVVAATDF
ncbi:hypothetical protein EYC84_009880 [Monilinia fructicola]|uniref:RRM domain-containing protein n=1 Tax=Monilinia fructicola TaxID=38448 RepID=A0A5M9JDR4_MONFR|nr:hypothetical protein EYC84_009880 [Monilinia fructicola]